MQTTRSLLGASRLPLTTKHGNKDFYKGACQINYSDLHWGLMTLSLDLHSWFLLGTRQAYVPGTNVRTGTPGVHLLRGPGKFRIHDDKVRYYVAPPPHVLQETKVGNELTTKTIRGP